jgi:hypothetical protein
MTRISDDSHRHQTNKAQYLAINQLMFDAVKGPAKGVLISHPLMNQCSTTML